MKKLIVNFFKDESGQTSTEYILLIAVVAMIILKMRKTIEEKLTTLVNKALDTDRILDGLNQ